MNNKINRFSLLFTLGATIAAAGCDGVATTSALNDAESQELIGGFPAGDARLDFAGALVVYDPKSSAPPMSFCSGSLVSTESVLTAKHCAQVINEISSYGLSVGFAMGPNSRAPSRIVPVVAYDAAPGNEGGFVGFGQDVAVLHLESPVTDVAPVVVKPLGAKQIGQKMVAIGYGVMDNSRNAGERRIGTQTVKAVQGRTFEILFGSFEAFYEWFSANGYDTEAFSHVEATPDAGVKGDSGRPAVDGGAPVFDGGAGRTDSGFPNDTGFPPYDPTAYARFIYDSTVLLDSYEAVTGGSPGDAQPCFGDSGSPLVRFNAKTARYEAWGVVSGGVGTAASVCDLGTVYATFGPEVLAYVKSSANWTDPCKDLSNVGACVGNVATRCTSLDEGNRRLSSLDCDLLGLQCQATPSSLSCGETPLVTSVPPRNNPKDAPNFAESAQLGFKTPEQR